MTVRELDLIGLHTFLERGRGGIAPAAGHAGGLAGCGGDRYDSGYGICDEGHPDLCDGRVAMSAYLWRLLC